MTDSRDELKEWDRPPVTCPIGDREDCKHFHIERGHAGCISDFNDESEFFCQHPDLDEEIEDEYCPILAEEMEEGG